MEEFKTLDASLIEALTIKIDKLEKQARKSICQSCVSMTNIADSQEYQIELLTDEVDKLKTALKSHQLCDKQILIDSLMQENNYLRKALESAKDDTKALQQFIKGIGQAHVYSEVFRKGAF
jgi:ATP-dependent Clp protease ATP-binding subunit ClpA